MKSLIFLIISIFLSFNTIISSTDIQITSYSIDTPLEYPIRIVQLSDLHNEQFGAENRTLIDLVKNQNPDLILLTGDMIEKSNESIDSTMQFVKKLVKIAPVYYGYGNNEVSWEQKWDSVLTDSNQKSTLAQAIEEAGAKVLEFDYDDIEINKNELRIGGCDGQYRTNDENNIGKTRYLIKTQFENDFEGTNRYKILLDHSPKKWVDCNYSFHYPVDLVFSGHYHGGQIIIPKLNCGLFVPNVGLFPKHVKGVFQEGSTTCVLSTGLGNSIKWIPRLNNPPEIVVVDLY